MEVLFFLATRDDAGGIRSIDDLQDDPAAEPLEVESPGALVALAFALCGSSNGALEQLRDATCQSFPVWALSAEFVAALESLSESDMDRVAESWLEKAGEHEVAADLYELTTCLTDLRDALLARQNREAELFALLEEKAL